MVIPFGPYEPDKSDVNAKVSGDVQNVIPILGSYGPVKSLVTLLDVFPQDLLGQFTAHDVDGTPYRFAGGPSGLFLADADNWNDVTRTGSGYNATVEAPWCFTQRGRQVFATNKNDDMQVFNLGSSTEFEDNPGDPPRAGIVRNIGNFLVLMDLTSDPERIHWSGLNNTEQWTPGLESSDYQDFPGGGPVLGCSETTNPIILQKRDIHQATFIPGSDVVFSFQKIFERRGAKSARSIASRGDRIVYVDEGEVNLITTGGGLANIGREKVDRTIFGTMSAPDIENIQVVIDPFNDRAYFAADFNGVGHYDRVFVYDFGLQRWSVIVVDILALMPIATLGMSIDDQETSIDDMEESWDDKKFQGGAPLLAVFDLTKRLCTFSGPNMPAVLTTARQGDLASGVTFVDSTMGVIETSEYTIAVGSSMKLSEPIIWGEETAPDEDTGRCDYRVEAKFNKFRMTTALGADWSHAQGIDVASMPAGSLL